MLIKRLAIKKSIRFIRIHKDDLTLEHCDIYDIYITGTNSLSVSYVYYISHDEIL